MDAAFPSLLPGLQHIRRAVHILHEQRALPGRYDGLHAHQSGLRHLPEHPVLQLYPVLASRIFFENQTSLIGVAHNGAPALSGAEHLDIILFQQLNCSVVHLSPLLIGFLGTDTRYRESLGGYPHKGSDMEHRLRPLWPHCVQSGS